MKIDLIIYFFVWNFFAYLEGTRDGSFYHANMTSSNPVKENLHWLFTLTRSIVLGLIGVLIYMEYSTLITIIYLTYLILTFSCIHNGFYFLTRHKLDNNIYPKGFFDDSTSSTATININADMRLTMFVVGLIGVIFLIIK